MNKNDIIIPKGITTEEMKVFAKVAKDVFLFAWYVFVIHPIRGKTQFKLYPYQIRVLYHFLRNRFNIILKFRQAGITELISLYCLWLAMFHRNKNIQIISIKDRVAKKVLRRIKYMYRNLPWYLKVPVVNGRPGEVGTSTEIEFSNGSTITSIPTTEDAGRSEAVSLLVIDEAAIVRWASQIWAAAFPTLSTGGSAIINSCVTGDTEIIGRHGEFRIEQVCPKTFGVQDISFMNLDILTHKLQWRKALYGLNKGVLETWEIKNQSDQIIKCTPTHKFLTPLGWRSAQDILTRDLYTINFETGISTIEQPPITEPPLIEVFKEVPGYPNYLITNLGRVIYKKTGEEKLSKPNKAGYLRIKLWHKKSNKNFTLARLVVENFRGQIPDSCVIDHINCNPKDNYITNLQTISPSENAQRSTKYSRNLIINNNTGKGASDIELVGYIKYLDINGYKPDRIIVKVKKRFDKIINRAYISRILSGRRNKSITLSKLTLIKKYSDTIYDITVEGDESYISKSTYISHNTPYGIGNFYHKTWVDAVAHGNEFYPIRLFWKMHPERDDYWYNSMSSALGPRRTAQEIDGDFLTSGNSVFDLLDIKAIEDSLSEMDIFEQRLNGRLIIMAPPPRGKELYIGADVASGRSRDYSAFSVMDRQGFEYAYFKGKVPVSQFAKILMKTGKEYNNSVLAPESNDIGLAVTTKIQDHGYPNLFYTTRFLKEKKENKPKIEKVPGWYTTTKNRSIIIEELEDDIRNDEIETYDKFFVQEAYTFIYDERNKPIAMGKGNANSGESDPLDDDENRYTDDSILAKSITNFIRKGKVTSTVIAPR